MSTDPNMLSAMERQAHALERMADAMEKLAAVVSSTRVTIPRTATIDHNTAKPWGGGAPGFNQENWKEKP